MILLDTNVISELWKPVPDPHVLAWVDAQVIDTLYLAAITVAELRFGIAAMPVGKRRETLDRRLEQEVLPLLAGRVLSFDLEASRAFAHLMVVAKEAGRAVGAADGYIAATAAASRLMVATRDTNPFEAAGISTVNPWMASL